jgi:hypothetical protein
MGGDVAVALAGVDDRVHRVATLGSTPDWRRPGMRQLDDPSKPIDQGEADRYAHWFADHLDPACHLERYVDRPDMAFELGGADFHVPARNAEDFRARLVAMAPAAADRVRVRTHPDLDHRAVTTSESALEAAAAWLTA